MKKTNLFIGLLMSLFILSCSSNDVNDPIDDSTIIGEWKLVSKQQGGNTIPLGDCEKGEGVIFSESLTANFIVVDYEGFEPNITQEGYENCDYRYASYNFLINETNQLLYLIVEGEGTTESIDDSITTYEVETLSSENLRIKSIALSQTGGIEDVEENSEVIDESNQQTYIYTRK